MATVPAPVANILPPGLIPEDPSEVAWPGTLPLELALGLHTTKQICEESGISPARWDQIRRQPGFIVQVKQYREALKREGLGFKLRAQLQSTALLKHAWKMIHDKETPATVVADLIKFMIRCAGLDESTNKAAAAAAAKAGPSFNVVINLD